MPHITQTGRKKAIKFEVSSWPFCCFHAFFLLVVAFLGAFESEFYGGSHRVVGLPGLYGRAQSYFLRPTLDKLVEPGTKNGKIVCLKFEDKSVKKRGDKNCQQKSCLGIIFQQA